MTEWVISSSILILTVIVLRTCFKGRISLRLQYALWGLVLLRLLVPVSFGSSNFSVANLTEAAQDTPAVQAVMDVGNLKIPPMSYEAAYETIVRNYEAEGIDVDSLQGSEREALEYEAYSKMEGRSLSEILGKAGLILWVSGCVFVAALFLITNIRFKRKIMSSRYNLAVRKENLDVYVTGEIDTPCLFGIRDPAIYVTYPVADDPTLLRHTLEHEATHYRHGDHVWAVLRCAALAIHWYNPLVWWAAVLSQRDGELACDEATIRRLGEGERAEYGRTLIGMTCRKKANVLIAATTMTTSGSGIKERILLIARKPKMALYTLLSVVLIAAIAVGCTFTGAKNQGPDTYEKLIDYLKEYSYELVKDRMEREEVYYIGGANDYALVYCSGMGPKLLLYRYDINGDSFVVREQASGEYAISGGLSVNHIMDGDKHIYFGTISDSHWIPQEDKQIELDWKTLVLFDAQGNSEIVNLGSHGYICVMDEPMTDFWVAVNGGNVPLKMDQFLEQGYSINEVQWYSEGIAAEGTMARGDIPTENTEPLAGTEAPDDAPPVNQPELFAKEPEDNKVCIAVQPTGLVHEGGAYLYIIPENQEILQEYYLAAAASAAKDSMLGNENTGWCIVYQDQWWNVQEDGTIYGRNGTISPGDGKELYALCEAAVRAAGIQAPVRPEEITNIKSATLRWDGKGEFTVTDPYALGKIENWFANSRRNGSASCWFTSVLTLELENGETKTVMIASDDCAAWMSEGVVYSFGEVTNVGIEGNEEFYSLFATDLVHEKAKEGADAMTELWYYTNFRMYGNAHSIEETFALMDMFKEYAVSNPTEWTVMIALRNSRGLDGAFGQYYAGVVAALYEADPATFRFACRQMIPEKDVDRAVYDLAFYWSITSEEARMMLEAENP